MQASGLRIMEMYRNALYQEDVEWELEKREWERGLRGYDEMGETWREDEGGEERGLWD